MPLAGMLTELIARHETQPEAPNGDAAELDDVDQDDDEEPVADEIDEEQPPEDPGADRRYRFRHPTASGKTIAAAGFVEAARTMGVLLLTHRRLLVGQFNSDLTTEGYGERFTDAITTGRGPLEANPITIQTYAWFARHVDSLSRDAYQLVICDEAHTALGEENERSDPAADRADVHRHDRDRAAHCQAGLRCLPSVGR